METDFKQQFSSGIRTLKYLVGQYEGNHDLSGRIGKERALRHMDILVTVFGDEEYVAEFTKYKRDAGLESYLGKKDYTQDKVYGTIKEVEFLKEYIGELNKDSEYEALHNGLGNLLELYSEIFNNWGKYERMFKNKAYDAVTNDEPEEVSVKEFEYEELITEGGTPNYQEDEIEYEEPEVEYQEPKTRVERRRKRRTR